jgi:hypothetical protein
MRRNKKVIKLISTNIIKITSISKKINLAILLIIALLLPGCAKYGGNWDCGTVKGIGCSSIDEAERVARDQILLNTGSGTKKKIKIKEHYEGFEKVPGNVLEVK